MLKTSRSRAAKAYNSLTPRRDNLETWKDGYIDSKTADRIGKKGLRSTINQILRQDGTVGDRPSLVLYGPQPVGTIIGEIAEFTRRVGGTSVNYQASMQVVDGVARVYYAKGEDLTWTAALGKTFNISARAHFCPIRDIDTNYNDEDKVLITNGEDFFAYLDINTLTVVPFVSLAAPTAPTLTVGAGLTGTNFPNRYKVTNGNRGETAASTTTVATTSKLRSEWSGATEYIDVVITRVTGATKYHIYYGTDTGAEAYLFSIDDPGTGTTVTWRDTGVVEPNIYRPAPVGDTTAGPICTRASFINGQIFLTGDKINPKYTRYGGTGKSILDFSPYGGGGYEPVGGNKEVPVKVAAFRRNDGSPAITVLCKGTNGFGKRYIFSPTTVGNISYFAVSEENGNDGTEAPDSVILANNQLWYLSKDGAKSTLTKAQIQTILSTEKVGDNIENFFRRLNTNSLEMSWGLNFEGRNYWGVAVGSEKNNQIIHLDLNELRRGAWMLPWDISSDWGWLYNDNEGRTHFCILQNNKILEFTENVATQDNGVTFPTGMNIGIQKFSKDGKDWADVSRVTFVINNPQGRINVGVSGKTEDEPLVLVGGEDFVVDNDAAGWGELSWGEVTWGDFMIVPDEYGLDRAEIVIEVDQELNWWSADVNTTQPNCTYEVADIIIEYENIGIKE